MTWAWDASRAAYTQGGQTLPLEQMRGVVDVRVRAARARMQSLADDMIAKRMSPVEWEIAMRREIKALHLQCRMAGTGGTASLSDLGYVGRRVRDEYEYLSKFGAQVRHGELSEAMIRDRAGKYAGSSAIDEFENARGHAMVTAGYVEKRRNAVNDGATCPTCGDESGMGWVAIDAVGWAIGDSECDGRCRCTIDYRAADGTINGGDAPGFVNAGTILNLAATQALMGMLAPKELAPQ